MRPIPTAGANRPRREWPVGSTMRPGSKGTRRLTRVYGPQLLCVRYRYDEKSRRRITTVELRVDEKPWTPPALAMVLVEILFEEAGIQDAVLRAGGKWDRARQLWRMPRGLAVKLGLRGRIREKALEPKGASNAISSPHPNRERTDSEGKWRRSR